MIAGNWKMYHTVSSSLDYLETFLLALPENPVADILLAPSYPSLFSVGHKLAGHPVKMAAQNLHFEEKGAFTGEVSAKMLKDCGCHAVIVGHSERRHVFGESDDLINKKLRAGVAAGLDVIFCVGETGDERKAGKTSTVIHSQLEKGLKDFPLENCKGLTIAYEPVWAIGTDVNATPEQAEEVHREIRQWVQTRFDEATGESIRILYGGSVKPGNAAELLSKAEIDGLLVGSASLDPKSFCAIIQSVQ